MCNILEVHQFKKYDNIICIVIDHLVNIIGYKQ